MPPFATVSVMPKLEPTKASAGGSETAVTVRSGFLTQIVPAAARQLFVSLASETAPPSSAQAPT